MSTRKKKPAEPAVDKQPEDKRWDDAVDWLLNSRYCADPDIQNLFWGIVDGKYTREEAHKL